MTRENIILDKLKHMLKVGGGSAYWFDHSCGDYATKIGFFRAQVVGGRWWLIDPQGQPWLSMGVSVVRNRPSPGYPLAAEMEYFKHAKQRYGDDKDWARMQAKRLRKWGFNTIGCWSSSEMMECGIPYTVLLEVTQFCGITPDMRHHGAFPDVFAPAFVKAVEQAVVQNALPHRDDPLLVGYFTDNELDWEQESKGTTMFDHFLAMEDGAPGKNELVRVLAAGYGNDLDNFRAMWDVTVDNFESIRTIKSLSPGPHANKQRVASDKDAFIAAVSRAYFSICERVIRAADPNHMILGCRFGGRAVPSCVVECGKHVDVISYNSYSDSADISQLQPIFESTLRPVMITEFSFKAMDSGLPNSHGAGIAVMTQEDRAGGYERYVTNALHLPYVVGLHWFMHHDQSQNGSDDRGENSNYGLVDGEDEPYCALVERMKKVNTNAIATALECGALGSTL